MVLDFRRCSRAEVISIIKDVISKQPKVELDRCHFKDFGPHSLIFEAVYYMLSKEYKDYIDTRQKINQEIFKRFKEKGIEFAYPTQTVFVKQP